MKKEILALTLSVAMLITGGLTSVTAAEFEDTSICADEVSSDVNEAFDSLDIREDTEVEFDDTENDFSSDEHVDFSYDAIDSSDSEFIADKTEVFTEDVGINDDTNPENPTVSVTPSREPLKPAVTESIVTGLEKPLKFYPSKFYNFTVTGAGMDNTDPIENDERWEDTENIQSLRITFESDSITTSELDSWVSSDKDEYGNPIPTEPPTIVMSTGEAAKIKVTVQKGKIKTKSISGLKKKVSVNKGKTLKLTPVLSPQTSQEKISYSSSNKKVATVSSKGIIKGIKAGTTKITVKSGTKKFVVTVTVPKTTTKKITGIKSAIKLKKGKTYKLKPKKVPANSDYKISYNSSNKKVATVSSKGVITARKKGSTTITIKSGKISVKCKVTVK